MGKRGGPGIAEGVAPVGAAAGVGEVEVAGAFGSAHTDDEIKRLLNQKTKTFLCMMRLSSSKFFVLTSA